MSVNTTIIVRQVQIRNSGSKSLYALPRRIYTNLMTIPLLKYVKIYQLIKDMISYVEAS